MQYGTDVPAKDCSIKRIIRATFPDYKKRKVKVIAAETVTLWGLNWCGGSINHYKACTFAGEYLGDTERFSMMWPGDNTAESKVVPIPQGVVIVKGGWFCGKVSTLYLYVNPADMPKYLR